MKKYTYDTTKFDFAQVIKNIFKTDDLDSIHNVLKHNNDIPDDPSKDQKTAFHKIFYASFEDENDEVLPLYRSFVKHIKDTHYKNKSLIYQARPTFRVHCPDNIAVAKWHKDKLYNHSDKEINIFLPITNAFGSNTIWAESKEDLGDYSPMNADYGEYFVWNGANLNHGNKKNDTGLSRVSFDFRVIEEKDFSYVGTSVTQKVEMSLGKYWSKVDEE